MIPRFRSSCKSRAADCRGGISPEDVENLLEQHSHGDSLKPHALRDFLASRFPDYCRSHPVTEEKLKVMNSLLSCKTLPKLRLSGRKALDRPPPGGSDPGYSLLPSRVHPAA